MSSYPPNSTIVLVHGAWADGSCWSNVILPLKREGLAVICAPIPLTSLTNDIAALNQVLQRTSGPVVVAGHAYAGGVIAGTTEARVKSLVYVAALAPDEGETVAQVFYRDPPHPEAPKLHARFVRLDMDVGRRIPPVPLPTTLLPIKRALRLPCKGQLRFSVFRSLLLRRDGKRNRPGIWWPKTTA